MLASSHKNSETTTSNLTGENLSSKHCLSNSNQLAHSKLTNALKNSYFIGYLVERHSESQTPRGEVRIVAGEEGIERDTQESQILESREGEEKLLH